jgi:hypothetical protein
VYTISRDNQVTLQNALKLRIDIRLNNINLPINVFHIFHVFVSLVYGLQTGLFLKRSRLHQIIEQTSRSEVQRTISWRKGINDGPLNIDDLDKITFHCIRTVTLLIKYRPTFALPGRLSAQLLLDFVGGLGETFSRIWDIYSQARKDNPAHKASHRSSHLSRSS